MGVYRIDTNRSVHLVAANVTKPNGIVISPDQKTLYVGNSDYPGNGNLTFLSDTLTAVKPTQKGSVLAYDLLPNGSLKFKSVLIDFENGGPDGMAVDVEGNLYIAMGDKVAVYSSSGKKITEIKTPSVANLCFGRGKFSKTLFMAGGTSVYKIEVKKEGYHIPATQVVK